VVQYMVSSQGCTPYRDCDRPAALARCIANRLNHIQKLYVASNRFCKRTSYLLVCRRYFYVFMALPSVPVLSFQ